MIDIREKSQCCGCTACVNACPRQCIVMRRDRKEGFDYPVANPDLCIGCGKCEAVCPVLNPRQETEPLEAFAARSRRFIDGSSSGGVFPLVAAGVISRGGAVFGAASDGQAEVSHRMAESIEEVEGMRGSKYVQSELFAAFEDVRSCLEAGREVLFTGLPCQVAGLKNWLGKDNDRLLTMDCACHGVPGPGLWEIYVKALEKRMDRKVEGVVFRDKSRSWYHYDFVVNGNRIPYMKDPYMALFVQNMTLRPSCYACPVRNGRSGSDLTLADLWNAAEVAGEMNDDRGVSLVCVNTDRGRRAFESVRGELSSVPVDFYEASKNNGGFAASVPVPEERDRFFSGLHSAPDVYGYMKSFVRRPPFTRRAFNAVRSLLVKLKKMLLS